LVPRTVSAPAHGGAIVNLIAADAPVRSVVGFASIDKETWSGFYVLHDSPLRTPRGLT
jgi:hypothetical protein